jgi:mono/diheme cytochrome c family protein
MIKTTHIIGACLLAAGLSGCSDSDFKPAEGMPVDQLFAQTCSGCHGDKGEGKFGFLLSIAGSDLSSEEIVQKIRQGGHIMPAFPNIGEKEATAVAEYVKSQ